MFNIKEKLVGFGRWVKKKIVWFFLGGSVLAASLGVPIITEEMKWQDFTTNLEMIEYVHEGEEVKDLKDFKGVWKPKEKDFKKVYQYVYGFDMVNWQSIDGTERCIKSDGTRWNCIPHWGQEFNNSKERGELEGDIVKGLRKGVRENVVNSNTVEEELKKSLPISQNRFDFGYWFSKLFQSVYAIGVEFEDHFTHISALALDTTTPDTTGTGYTELILVGVGDMTSGGSQNDLRYGGIGSNEGQLVEADDALSEPNQIIQIYQKNGDTGDDNNLICCRIQDANNMYCLHFNESYSYLYKRLGGDWSIIAEDGGGIADTSTVELICNGITISAEDDDAVILSTTDSSHLAAGKAAVGMGAVIVATDDGSSQLLDDFVITVEESGPIIATNTVSAIKDTEAIGNGNVLVINDTNITERGFVYDTSSHGDPGDVSPAVSDYPDVVNESGTYSTGAFSVTITSLSEHTLYYVRGYAKNDDDPVEYGYGDEVIFDAGRIREVDTTSSDFGDGSHTNTIPISNNVELALSTSEVDDESFEVNDGDWADQVCTGCGSECWARGNLTGSGSTGPATNHGADGNYFQFLEASGGYCGDNNDADYIEYTLSESTLGDIDFCYHMYGSNMGALYLDYYDGSWNNFWSIAGQQHVAENTPWTCITGEIWGGAATKIRFRGVAIGGFLGDMAFDDVQVNESSGYQASGNYVSDSLETDELFSVDDGHIYWSVTTNGQTLVVSTDVSYNDGGAWEGYNVIASSGDAIPDIEGISSTPEDGLVRYKLELSGDEVDTPQVHDVTIDREYEEAGEPAGGWGWTTFPE